MTLRARGPKRVPKRANRATCVESSNTLSYNLEIIYFTKTNSTMPDIKVQMPKFDGKPSSDYGLWLCRLEAILETKWFAHRIQDSDERAVPAESASTDIFDAALQVRKTSSIIVNGLAEKPLRIVCAYCKYPLKMIQNLNERYSSSTLSTSMSVM
jgi:hypothetical protein